MSDGNCFYRALAFRFFELMQAKAQAFTSDASTSTDTHYSINAILGVFESHVEDILMKSGFQEFAYQDFYDEFMQLLRAVLMPNDRGLEEYINVQSANGYSINNDGLPLERILNCDVISNSVVVHLRFITSGYLKVNQELYAPFMDGDMSVVEYCEHFVEAMDREADQIHIIALSNAMHIPINVAYLDQSRSEEDICTVHKFGEDYCIDPILDKDQLVLLYRPGHYDIIYEQR